MPELTPAPPLYRHSGKVPPAAAIVALISSILAATLLGYLYGSLQFLVQLIPYMKCRAMVVLCLMLGFGLLLGIIPSFILVKLKARSLPAAIALAAITSLVAYYFAWSGWFYGLFLYIKDPAPPLNLINPSYLFPLITQLYRVGFTPFVGDPSTGVLLAMAWISELTLIILFAGAFAKSQMNAKVFCENCRTWGTRRPLMSIKDPDSTQLGNALKELRSGNLDPLNAIASPPVGEPSWLDLSLEGCPTCDNLQTLTIIRQKIVKTKKGSNQSKSTLLKRLLLSPDQTVSLALTAASLTSSPPQEAPPPAPTPSPT